MTNHITPIRTPYFAFDGRGPTRTHWITQAALYLPETIAHLAGPLDDIVGAHYAGGAADASDARGAAWVICAGVQVLLGVPEEVHSYWHRDRVDPHQPASGVWQVTESTWMQSFQARHLGDHSHFILEFYDEIVEVICRDLVFGHGTFSIAHVMNHDGRFAEAHLHAAETLERHGQWDRASSHYRSYVALATDTRAVAYAKRRLAALTSREPSTDAAT